ncbi:amidohydrolase [Novosphingobium sp. TH158]|uniref:amidohydrolase n=1 Tax=Novosphingobium sp. TH158 TaxID=2067455 RepID=UPI000C7C2172|nr:amidohydrolase [Novosphingobium sp. TH158]PLK26021.1 amidohydrolase [Novosphingobium sp. TH158]
MKLIATLLAGAAALSSIPAQADAISDSIKAEMPGLMAIYRDLHANPELSFEEKRSAKIMADAARKAGFEVTENVGKTGVVAVMKNGPGPVVLIRADMDGLPVIEQTGLPYASKVRGVSTAGVESGVMHACGHDTHMTAWIAVARYLAANRKDWSGTLVMVGQPAEELGLGARAMLEDGLYTRFPKPQYTLAFHDTHELPSGVIGVTPGYALANVDSVDITFKGIGGHGSRPHQTKDPIVLASAFVTRVQTLVSRENDPSVPAVVTVGSFHAGAKHNIISDKAELQLTVRSYADDVRARLLSGIKRVAEGEAVVAGLPADLKPTVEVREPYTRSTFNTPDFSKDMLGFFQSRFGPARAREVPASMGGEDFGEFGRADAAGIKSMIFWVGGTPAEKLASEGSNVPGTHSPFFAPEADKVIGTAAEALIAASMRLLPKKQ